MKGRVAGVVTGMALALVLPAALLATHGSLAASERVTFLARLLYWTMPAVLLLWVVAGVRRWRHERMSGGPFLRRHAPGLGLAALGTGLVLFVSPPAMRMQFDETSLLGTSMNMHDSRIAMMAVVAVPAVGGPVVLDWNLDKRPPLFPFVVSVLHDLTGYRIANAFAVNTICLLALLWLVYAGTRRWLPVTAALAAPLWLLAVPLVAVTATSAGFELFAVVLLTVAVLAAIDFASAPSPVRLGWLLASCLVLAQSRYESVFVVIVLLALVAAGVRRWPMDGFVRTLLVLTPGLLVPLALLLHHSRDPAFYVESVGKSLLSLGHGLEHLPPLFAAWFAPAIENPFPGALGIVSVAVLAWWLVRHRPTLVLGVVVVPVLAATAIVLLWFYGDVREATAVRLYLPVAVLGALGPLLLPRLVAARWLPAVLLALAAAFAALRLREVHADRVLPRHEPAQVLDAVDRALEQVAPAREQTLLVSVVAQYLIVQGYAAMPPTAVAVRTRGLALREVLVLETPFDEDGPASIRALLASRQAQVVLRTGGEFPITVHRLLH